MFLYIAKRCFYAVISLFLIITITFFLIRIIPGNPLEAMTEQLPEKVRENVFEQYGYNQPLPVQYYKFWEQLLTEGDLGESLKYRGRKVTNTITEYAPISGQLGAQALFVGVIIGVTLGYIAAFSQGRLPDYLVMTIAILGVSVPNFVLASLLQYFLAIKGGHFPITGWSSFAHTILPTLALSFSSVAKYARYMRANCLDVINQDYILTARAKGASGFRVWRKHIFRNSILPIITLIGPQIALMFGGSFVIEKIFAIPGLGSYFVSSVTTRDYPMIMGQTIFLAALYILSLLVVDIVYGLVDPRIRIAKES